MVGIAYTNGGTNHAFLYSNGTMTDLGYTSRRLRECGNRHKCQWAGGGVADTSSGPYHAFLYSNGNDD